MIQATKVTLSGGLIFSPARIYTNSEIQKLGLPLWFEDATLGVETEEGKILIPTYKIVDIHINTSRKTISKNLCRTVRRISLAGEMTYGPCQLVLPLKHKEAGIPQIFKPYEQFSFATTDGLHITSDFCVYGILL